MLAPITHGKLHAVYLSYGSTMTSSTCVQLTQMDAPSALFLDIAASSASAWFYPRTALSTSTGIAVANTSAAYPVAGALLARAASGAASGKVKVFAYIEDE
jgi:hypothetical protein